MQRAKKTKEEANNFSELGGIDVFISFKTSKAPPQKDIDEIASQLVNFCAHWATNSCNTREMTDLFESNFSLLQKYVDEISIRRSRISNWAWNSASQSGADESDLERTLGKKLKTQQPEPADEKWLLVISDLHTQSEQLGLVDTNRLAKYECLNSKLCNGPFDKIYIYQHRHSRILCWTRAKSWHEINPADTGIRRDD